MKKSFLTHTRFTRPNDAMDGLDLSSTAKTCFYNHFGFRAWGHNSCPNCGEDLTPPLLKKDFKLFHQ